MGILRSLMRMVMGLLLSILLLSYLGALHPLGDSLAMFRQWIAYTVGAAGLVALILRVRWLGSGAVIAATASVLHLASFNTLSTPTPVSQPDLVIYAKNLLGRWGDLPAIVADIETADADVVLLQEMTPETVAALSALLPDHPHHHFCRYSGWSTMAVVSRFPLSQTGCTDHRSLAYAVTDTPTGPVWVASIHQVWPYPHQQASLLPDVLAAIETAPPRRVVAGDFNMVPWGHSVQRIMAAGAMQRISPLLDTIEVRGVGFPIDHVLTTGQGTANLRDKLGSDHAGLVSRIAWN